jgi:ATP-dependent RNA helicase RhlE
MSFDSLGLIPQLLAAVRDQGYTEPTPIQAQAIPPVLARHDVMGCAQTGTGKTAGFALPILQLLAPEQNASPSPARHLTRALILAPTRELAAQIYESFVGYSKHLQLRSTVVFGGVDMKPQTAALRAGVEILVATPGRLLDHVQSKTVNLQQVGILVLDEADRMLDMGFMPDIKRILSLIPAKRQTLLFSATFSDEIRRLAKEILRDPVSIEVARRNAPAELVTHSLYEVPAERKRRLLEQLVRTRDMKQVLVFTRTKREANRLARELKRDGFEAREIHSDRTQAERMDALAAFKEGGVNILVATDIAARGIDIEDLPFVVNYELPYVSEDYVHRIGRTGRAGTPGEAISLVSPDEMRYLADIEKILKKKIERRTVPAGSAPAEAHGGRVHHPATPPAAAPRPRQHAPAKAASSAPAVPAANGDFDFTKPYEPALANATPAPAEAHTHRASAPSRRPARQTPALLGGLATKKA